MKKSMLTILTLGVVMMISANAQANAQNLKKESGKNSNSGNQEKTVVCYFSATGTTERLAKTVASTLGADLHEIVPSQKYSSADLNWHDSKSRSSIESNDEKSRPAIANKIDLKNYDTVVLAYPIWWGLAPKIMYSFVEQNDLSGKKIVALCTSGGSGLGRSGTDLAKHSKGASYIGGREFRGSAGSAEIKKYFDGILK